MRKFVTLVILVPLTVAIVLFAVANREIITVSFDPFDSVQPVYVVKMPLFLLIFALVALGVVIGGVAAWLRQHKWRVRARRAESETRELHAALDAQRTRSSASVPAEAPPLTVPPAA